MPCTHAQARTRPKRTSRRSRGKPDCASFLLLEYEKLTERAAGLGTRRLEKWIHRWIKRQRSTKGRGNRKISPRVSKYAPDPAGASDGICAQAQTMLLDGSAHPGSSLESHSSMYAWQSNDPLWRHVPDSSAASGSGDSSLCYGMGSWGGSNAGSDPLSPRTSYSISGQGSLHAGPHDTPQASTAPQAPSASQAAPAPQVVQVARPGASFTVPLRFGPPDSQHRIAQTLPSGIDDRSVTGAAHLSPHPMSNETPPSLEHAHPGLSDVHAHTVSPLNSRAHCLDLKHLHIPSSGHTTAMSGLNPPLSAPPSAFSLPATCASEALNLGGAYLYRLFNGPGDDSAIEAPPFHSTCYYGEAVASTAGVPPDLWSPPHTFVSDTSATGVAAEDVPNLAYPPTPVSYEMRMSDLVALTKSIRGAKDAEDAGRALSSLIKYEDAAEIGDNLAQTLASEPQSSGERSARYSMRSSQMLTCAYRHRPSSV